MLWGYIPNVRAEIFLHSTRITPRRLVIILLVITRRALHNRGSRLSRTLCPELKTPSSLSIETCFLYRTSRRYEAHDLRLLRDTFANLGGVMSASSSVLTLHSSFRSTCIPANVFCAELFCPAHSSSVHSSRPILFLPLPVPATR